MPCFCFCCETWLDHGFPSYCMFISKFACNPMFSFFFHLSQLQPAIFQWHTISLRAKVEGIKKIKQNKYLFLYVPFCFLFSFSIFIIIATDSNYSFCYYNTRIYDKNMAWKKYRESDWGPYTIFVVQSSAHAGIINSTTVYDDDEGLFSFSFSDCVEKKLNCVTSNFSTRISNTHAYSPLCMHSQK